MALQQFGGVKGIVFYASTIFISADSNESMTALGVILMDKSGRSPLFLNLQLWKQITPILAPVGVLVFTGSFSLGMGGLPWVIVSEIFPINMKGSAGSLVTLVTWLGSWINSYVLIDWNSAGTFFLFSSLSAATIFVKAGTREEIQTSMNRFSANR